MNLKIITMALALMVLGAFAISPAHAWFAIKSLEGQCLDVRGDKPSDRTYIQMYSCNGTRAQKWRRPALGFQVQPGVNKLLDHPYTAAGERVWTFHAMTDATNQQWEVAEAIVMVQGQNVVFYEPPAGNGQHIAVGARSENGIPPAMRVTFTKDHELRLPDGRCLEPSSCTDFSPIVANACGRPTLASPDAQRWDISWEGSPDISGQPLGGKIRSKACTYGGDKVLDVPHLTTGEVFLRQNNTAPNQRFELQGAIRSVRGPCLTRYAGAKDEDVTFVRSCDGSPEQQWIMSLQ